MGRWGSSGRRGGGGGRGAVHWLHNSKTGLPYNKPVSIDFNMFKHDLMISN